jgi:KDO2-lipid IV(A) lauroyltransferase
MLAERERSPNLSARLTMQRDFSLTKFWSPRYWPTWLVLGLMHLAARLPIRWQLRMGRGLGRVLLRVKRRQRRIARRNIELCFPELSAPERERLVARHFESVGMSFVEMSIGWFMPLDELLRRAEISGREHLETALARGKGALLFSAHFTTLELGPVFLGALIERCSCMYRPQRNAMMDTILRRGRSRFAREQIPSDNIRALIRSLRENYAVVYMPDQTNVGKQSELLPFFGIPAVTNTATSKLAQLTGAAVLTYFFRRLPDGRYRIDIGEPLADFPSGDAKADTARLFDLLESYVREAPEQYLWMYKKFKGRPSPLPDVYADLAT